MTAERLKNSILQLAMRGKLVKQDPKDEPASKLLEKIKKEREKLIEEKKIKKEKYSEIYKDFSNNHYYEKFEDGSINDITCEIPFEIPKSWRWEKFDNIFNIINGFTPLKSNSDFWNAKEINWFTIEDYNKQGYEINYTNKFITNKALGRNSNRILPKDTVIICCTASIGTVAIANIPLTTKQQFNGLVKKEYFKNFYNSKFIYYYCLTLKRVMLDKAGKTTFPFLSVKKLSEFYIPLPPINEQKRIVEKIESFLPYFEKYNNIYMKLETLNKSYKEELKKSILQYVVQGKLVKQDLEDEMAEDLINKILDEKRELIKNKKIKKENLSVIYKKCEDNQFYEKFDDGTINNITEEIPFEIPNNWVWTRLGTILKKLTDGTHKTPKYTNTGIPFLSVKDMSLGIINFDNTKFISEEEHKLLYERCNPEKGDIILSKIGTTGIPVIINTDRQFSLFVSVALLKFNSNLINREFLKYILLSPLVQKQCKENTKGVGNKNWVIKDIANTLIVLPSLNEQCRIAKKIEMLFNNL